MENKQKPVLICGVIMPISSIDGCNESHWAEVLEILKDSIESAGFQSNLVSNADDVGIIHKRIIQNLYDNPIVVCDVSGKNPNVMFELGMRLAFDKPTIIVKDDVTSYSFDTSGIEHLEYPRDLRFSRIQEFKKKLAEKIAATYEKSQSDSSYTTFLKHFGEFKVAKIDKKEVSGQEFIIEELKGVKLSLRRLELMGRDNEHLHQGFNGKRESHMSLCLRDLSRPRMHEFQEIAIRHPDVDTARIKLIGNGHYHLEVNVKPGVPIERVESELDVERFKKSFGNRADTPTKTQ